MPGGIAEQAWHLLARRIVVPHPRGGAESTSPPRCRRTCSSRGTCSASTLRDNDPIVDAPEE